jgi:hypothetical protein
MRKLLLRLSPLALLVVAPFVACGGSGAATPGSVVPKAASADPFAPPLPTKPESDKVTWKKDPSYAKCHNDVKTGADLAAGVAAMAQPCAAPLKMHQVGQLVQGSRQNLDPAQSIPLHAEAGHCYRVYGLSEDALQDLDIAIVDSAGKTAAEDGSDSPDSVVLEDGVVCFTQTDDVKVNVAAGNGGGKFAVAIWSD